MTLDDEVVAAKFASQAIDRLRKAGDGRSLTWQLFNGVRILCQPYPQSYMQALAEAMPQPKPPIIHIAAQAGKEARDEENADDPNYQAELLVWSKTWSEARAKLIIAMGTKLDFCPENIRPPESDEWIADVKRAEKFTHKKLDLEIDDPDMRFISWLRFYAVDNETDMAILLNLPQFLSGLREAEVAIALDAFRGLTARPADPELPAAEPSQNGDSDNRAARRRSARV